MAYIASHVKDCKYFLGHEYVEVHDFLDKYAHLFDPNFFDDYHRTFLHNSYGLNIVRSIWGEHGYKAAILHLTRDYVGATIDHWTLDNIIKEFPRRLMWFDQMNTNFQVKPHVIRGWNNISLVALSTL